MAHQDAFALGRSDLNGFLFADIGVEGSGMSLSVISARARHGLDPWQEAGRLARLPRTVAADGLARLIAAMPDGVWPMPDATAIAARLVALLPGQGGRASVANTVWSSTSLRSPKRGQVCRADRGYRDDNPACGVATFVARTPRAWPGSAPPATLAPINSVPTGD